jgi:uncharacterized membrane protein YvbJ
MKCNICGRQSQNEEANFCEYCGSSFRETSRTPYPINPREQVSQENYNQLPGVGMQAPYRMNAQNTTETEKPVSFLNWLGTYGMLFIPIAGGLIFIVMLFVWSFSGNTPTSKKNWARVTLIFSAIMLILFIGYLIVLFSTPMFRDMMNGTFDYNSYYDSLYQSYN